MIAFSSFEFFFRDGNLLLVWAIPCLLMLFRHIYCIRFSIKALFVFLFFIFFFQGLLFPHFSILGCFTRILPWLSAFALACIINSNYRKVFVDIVTFIAAYSLFIYMLSYIPSIREFLIYKICPMFPSLNLQAAIQEGGGQNFIIYNYQVDYLNESIGFYRNCGPFWEPGMFACFLNLALYLNLNYSGSKWISLLLFITTVSTFSTGGFLGLLYIIFSYFQLNSKGNYFVYILGLIIILALSFFLSNLSFIGTKVLNQLDNATVGTDTSRFGAILTQLDMISTSPIIGGENLESYTESGTLSSAVLLPFVNYGLLFGLYFYFIFFKSCINNSYKWGKGKKEGVFLFLLIVLLSISQTIIFNMFVLVLMFCGLIKSKKYGTV